MARRRRTTTIGIGAFGYTIDRDEHLKDTYNKIITRRLPLTEDAVFIMTLFMLSQRNQGSRFFKAVRTSKSISNKGFFSFIPDIDLLEVRVDNSVVGYELKGLQKAKGSIDHTRVIPTRRKVRSIEGMKPFTFYEGLDQALTYLINPIVSPISDKFPSHASIFDYVYLVHPEREITSGTAISAFANMVKNCTPVGLIYISHNWWKEIVSPKPNPFLNQELKELFLQNLEAFNIYTKFKLSLIQ